MWKPTSVSIAVVLVALLSTIQIANAQPATPLPTPKEIAEANTLRITLDEVKHRVLADNKLLQMAALNVQSKGNAARAVRSSYFPQVIGQSIFVHFNDNLGSVLSTPGRTISGPLGRPLAMLPAATFDVPVVNQNTALNMVMVAQPLTDVLKVRAGVKIARADEQIAQAQLEKGTRELLSGVEQIYWGLLIAGKIRAGAAAAVEGTEPLAKKGSLEARIALVEARQALHEIANQIADLEGQMALVLDVPSGTRFELADLPAPAMPVRAAEEAVALALAHSPEIREAEQILCKARAAVAAGKLDYVPSIAIVGGYANQTMADYIQPNIGFVGVVGSYTFLDWGKRRFTIRERNDMAAMASLKIQQTQDEVRQKTMKAYRDAVQSEQAVSLAAELAAVRQEAAKAAKTPQAMYQAAKDALTAQVDYLKADLNHHIAFTKLSSLIAPQ